MPQLVTELAVLVRASSVHSEDGCQVRRVWLDECSILWYVGGKSEKGGPVADSGATSPHARRSWSTPPPPGVGCRPVVRERRSLLLRPRQGPGQVRDAARPPGGRSACGQRSQPARLLASCLLPGSRGVRRGRHAGPARRKTRPPWTAQSHSGNQRVRTLRPAPFGRRAV